MFGSHLLFRCPLLARSCRSVPVHSRRFKEVCGPWGEITRMNPCFTSFKATAHNCWFECEVADAEATEKPRAGTMVPLWRFFQAPNAAELVAAEGER